MIRLRHRIPRFRPRGASVQAMTVGAVATALAFAMPALARAEGGIPAGSQSVSYQRDIRPILADKCFKCHGPDAGERKGKLRLDNATGTRKAGRVGQRCHRARKAR